ncbi:MAG: hypothetical protein Kow0090_21200 [Myxococcota bacterium]
MANIKGENINNTLEERWLSLAEIIEILRSEHNIELTEASFRKYVQLELLPRSKRIGQKGKHKGSSGIYPAGIIERIVLIKRLMQDDLTLEDIRDSVMVFQNKTDSIKGDIFEITQRLLAEGGKAELSESELLQLERGAAEIKRDGEALVARIEKLVKIINKAKLKPAR